MKTYISILRGINVSGHRIIKMNALKQMFESLRFINVQTYVQSGNVIFSSEESETKEIEAIISSEIEAKFGFEVPVIVLSQETLATIVQNNPFANDDRRETSHLHVTFLAETLGEFSKSSIIEKKLPNEEIEFTSNAIFLYCPHGYGKTKLNNSFLEKKLNVQATTRNWKTTNELLELATR